jgi:SAM-dependent methyltransferase
MSKRSGMSSKEIQQVEVRPGTLKRWYAMKHILQSRIKDGQVVLDVGGYDGFIAYKLTEIYPNLEATVVDPDDSGLKLAKKRGLSVLSASADALPIRDNSVDVMICFDLIEQVENSAGVIKEVSRALKENGIVFLTCGFKNRTMIPFKDMTMIYNSWGLVRNGYEFAEIKNLFDSNSLHICKRGRIANIFSRYAYYLAFLSKIPLRGKGRLYRALIKLEPFVKIRAMEHAIVGMKSTKASYHEKEDRQT